MAQFRNGFSLSKLHCAAERGDVKEVLRLLQEELWDVNEDGLGLTPLYFAASNNHAGVAEILLNYNADVNKGIIPPLHAAVNNGHVQMVKWLLERGADPNKPSRQLVGCMALHLAALHSKVEIVEILLAHGADPNIKNWNGKSSFDMVKDKDSALYKMLLNCKKDQGKKKLMANIGDAMEEYFNKNRGCKPDGAVTVSCDITLAQDNTKTQFQNLQISATGVPDKGDTSHLSKTLDTIHSDVSDIKNMVTKMNHVSLQPSQTASTVVPRLTKGSNKRERVRKNLVLFTTDLHNINFICEYLIQDDVITISEKEIIMAEKSDRQRAHKLLTECLLKKDEFAIEVFCKALREEGQKHLANAIED